MMCLVLFGPFLWRSGDIEHACNPILKLIDFGSAGPKKPEGQVLYVKVTGAVELIHLLSEEGSYEGTAEQNNIYEIGTVGKQ
jgi:hypothetical protein